jgi:hypothetical protein
VLSIVSWEKTEGVSASVNQSHIGKITHYYLYCPSILENAAKDLEAIKISSVPLGNYFNTHAIIKSP